ncbi:PepSY-like domain-containing protein [Brachyspira sp.]|uniref:PepSY-like domain-containing protein n=1 Tax=Brachyspira sp. TaxID=1977261 RepID=UPI0026164732|nr:PepSY-like domain-containing protein [Brachyspira sp.]
MYLQKNTTLPTKFIPANILKTVQKKYAQVAILEIGKEYLNYKIKLVNNREIYIDNIGKSLSINYTNNKVQ